MKLTEEQLVKLHELYNEWDEWEDTYSEGYRDGLTDAMKILGVNDHIISFIREDD